MNIHLVIKAVGQCALVALHGAHSAPILEHLLRAAHLMNGPEHGALHLFLSAVSLCGLIHHVAHEEHQHVAGNEPAQSEHVEASDPVVDEEPAKGEDSADGDAH